MQALKSLLIHYHVYLLHHQVLVHQVNAVGYILYSSYPNPESIKDTLIVIFVISGMLGVEVCGVIDITVSNSSLEWQWEGFGLKLHVDANTLPSGIEHCCLTVSASLAGQYKFPRDHHLVSAVIWFRCEPPCRFVKPIKVELQHCAYRYNISKLDFVKALCSQKELPYEFKRIARSSFSSHSCFGVLEVNSFSGLVSHCTTRQLYVAYAGLSRLILYSRKFSHSTKFHGFRG